MHSIASKGIHSVDGLLMALKTNIKDDDKSTLSMKKTIEKIMKEYAMFHDFASRVTVNIVSDFKFQGSLLFTKHMLFKCNTLNLKQNSFINLNRTRRRTPIINLYQSIY
jgi:hypothetical protein